MYELYLDFKSVQLDKFVLRFMKLQDFSLINVPRKGHFSVAYEGLGIF